MRIWISIKSVRLKSVFYFLSITKCVLIDGLNNWFNDFFSFFYVCMWGRFFFITLKIFIHAINHFFMIRSDQMVSIFYLFFKINPESRLSLDITYNNQQHQRNLTTLFILVEYLIIMQVLLEKKSFFWRFSSIYLTIYPKNYLVIKYCLLKYVI